MAQNYESGPIDNDQGDEARELIIQMRRDFGNALEAERHNMAEAMEDIKFANVPGYQWDESMKKERGNRPCWEFNKIRVTNKRVINNMRANRPDGKVRPVEGGDKKRAETLAGLVRNILNQSDADTVLDYAGGFQAAGGMGCWRIVTEYADDDSFNQDIRVKSIANPFTLFPDPSAQDQMRRDARFFILTERVTKDEYDERWPDAEQIPFPDHEFDDDDEWENKEQEIRVAEYWYKVEAEKEIWQLQTGQVIESTAPEAQAIESQFPEMIVKRREVKYHKIMSCIMSGTAILEGPTEWPGKYFPFVVVYGDFMVIDGKTYWYGLTRFARDAQKSYNVSRTALSEGIAGTPQTFFWATQKQAEGNVKNWKTAHQKRMPFMIYTHDPEAPGAPQRMGPADVPVALIQETQMAAEEVNMVTGIYQHDIGAPNPAKSGYQEALRANAGSLASYHIEDNMAKGVQHTWEILLDLVPKIYDTERAVRVLGSDGAEDYVTINKFVPNTFPPQKINDITVGKYDVTVTTGPSYATLRTEAADTYQRMIQTSPELMPIIGDLVFKTFDFPYVDDIAERLQAMAPPQIQQLLQKDQQMPPEVQQAMQRVDQMMQMVQQQQEAATQATQEAEMEQSKAQKLISDIKAARAEFDAHVSEEMAGLKSEAASVKVAKAELNVQLMEQEHTEEELEKIRQAGDELNSRHANATLQMVDAIAAVAESFEEQLSEISGRIPQQKKVIRMDSERDEKGNLRMVPVYEE